MSDKQISCLVWSTSAYSWPTIVFLKQCFTWPCTKYSTVQLNKAQNCKLSMLTRIKTQQQIQMNEWITHLTAWQIAPSETKKTWVCWNRPGATSKANDNGIKILTQLHCYQVTRPLSEMPFWKAVKEECIKWQKNEWVSYTINITFHYGYDWCFIRREEECSQVEAMLGTADIFHKTSAQCYDNSTEEWTF